MAIEFWKQDTAIDLLTPDQLKSLGIISVECSAIEEYVNGLLPVAAGTSEESAVVLLGAGAPLGRKIEMLQELASLNFEGAKQAQFLEALALAKTANADRSILLHGVWQNAGNALIEYLSGIPRQPGNAEIVNRRRPKQKTVKAAELPEISSKISAAHRAVYELWVEYLIKPALLQGADMVKETLNLVNEHTAPKHSGSV